MFQLSARSNYPPPRPNPIVMILDTWRSNRVIFLFWLTVLEMSRDGSTELDTYQLIPDSVAMETQQSATVVQKSSTGMSVLNTLRRIYSAFWPVFITMFLQYIMPFFSVLFAGHLNTESLAAVGMATSVINITGVGIGAGMCSGFDTLAPQALGARRPHKVGILLQVLLMVLAVMSCLVIAVWVNMDALLVLCHQPVQVAKETGTFLLIYIPGLLCLLLFRSLRSYVLIQGCTKPPIVTCFICVVLHVVSSYILIYPLNLGLVGVALATTLSMICMPLSLIVYIYKAKLYCSTWRGFSSQSLLDWTGFVKLSVTGTMALMFEISFNELTVFLMGLVGTKELGAQAVLFQIKLLVNMAALAWGLASCYLIGQALGAGNPTLAKRITKYGLVAIVVFGTLVCVILVLAKDLLGRMFSSDPAVRKLISDGASLMAVAVLCESIFFYTEQVSIGLSKPHFALISVAVGSYTVGLPVSVALTFYQRLGLTGMWIGICCGLLVQAVVSVIGVFCRVDFKKASVAAQTKAGVQSPASVGYGTIKSEAAGGNTCLFVNWEESLVVVGLQDRAMLSHRNCISCSESNNSDNEYQNLTEKTAEEEDNGGDVTKAVIREKCLIFAAAVAVLVIGVVIRLAS